MQVVKFNYKTLDKIAMAAVVLPRGKVVFVAHCLLNQFTRAQGVKNVYKEGEYTPGCVRPLVELLAKYGIAIEQLPCPELLYEGLIRKAAGLERYDIPEYRELCGNLAKQVVDLIEQLHRAGYKVCCIIGVNGSPSCGVDFTFYCGQKIREKGIFIKAIEEELNRRNIYVPMIGARLRTKNQIYKLIRDVELYIK